MMANVKVFFFQSSVSSQTDFYQVQLSSFLDKGQKALESQHDSNRRRVAIHGRQKS